MQITVDPLERLCSLMRGLMREGIMVLLAVNAGLTEGTQRRLSVELEPISHRVFNGLIKLVSINMAQAMMPEVPGQRGMSRES
jgi:hypothetical protein